MWICEHNARAQMRCDGKSNWGAEKWCDDNYSVPLTSRHAERLTWSALRSASISLGHSTDFNASPFMAFCVSAQSVLRNCQYRCVDNWNWRATKMPTTFDSLRFQREFCHTIFNRNHRHQSSEPSLRHYHYSYPPIRATSYHTFSRIFRRHSFGGTGGRTHAITQ